MKLIDGPAFSFESQRVQYAYRDTPGLAYERHSLGVWPAITIIDCLLMRDSEGLLVGILNHYPDDSNPLETPGNINVFVHPECYRQGIATALVREAARRWPDLEPDQQRYTPLGVAFLDGLIKNGVLAEFGK